MPKRDRSVSTAKGGRKAPRRDLEDLEFPEILSAVEDSGDEEAATQPVPIVAAAQSMPRVADGVSIRLGCVLSHRSMYF